MEIKEKIMLYFTTIEGYDYNDIECNADYIFENTMAYSDKISTIIPNEDNCSFKDIFKLSLNYISKENIDIILNFFKNEMKHEKNIEKEILVVLKTNKNLTLNQLKDICIIENYCKSPGPSKLKHELSIIQECDGEFNINKNSLHIK